MKAFCSAPSVSHQRLNLRNKPDNPLCRNHRPVNITRSAKRFIITNAINPGATSREPAARAQSTQRGDVPLFSKRAEELIQKQIAVPIFDSSKLPGLFSEISQIAQDQARFISELELKNIGNSPGTFAAGRLSKSVDSLVEKAKEHVNQKFPGITEEGGGLYPAFRAEACWRDYWHFTRVVSYGVAAQVYDFLSDDGVKNMNELYKELGIPLDAMLAGVENLKDESLKLVEEDEKEGVEKAFQTLSSKLKTFG